MVSKKLHTQAKPVVYPNVGNIFPKMQETASLVSVSGKDLGICRCLHSDQEPYNQSFHSLQPQQGLSWTLCPIFRTTFQKRGEATGEQQEWFELQTISPVGKDWNDLHHLTLRRLRRDLKAILQYEMGCHKDGNKLLYRSPGDRVRSQGLKFQQGVTREDVKQACRKKASDN